MSSPKMSRRNFLDRILQGGLLATLGGFLAPALSYLWPVMQSGPSLEMKEVGLENEIPVGGSKKVILAGSALLLVRLPDGFRAFSAICTHLGCIVEWDGPNREILCPCHAGVFDAEGRMVSGPPPRPLPTYKVTVMDGKIYVKP